MSEEVRRRLTERRRPGDEKFAEEQAQKELTKKEKATSESKKYKVLMAVRNAQKREELSGDSSEEDDEELEYDQEEDEEHSENISLGNDSKKTSNNKFAALEKLESKNEPKQSSGKSNGVGVSKEQSLEEEEEEEEEEEDEEDGEEEEDDDDEDESSGEEEESSSTSAKVDATGQGSKSKGLCSGNIFNGVWLGVCDRIDQFVSCSSALIHNLLNCVLVFN